MLSSMAAVQQVDSKPKKPLPEDFQILDAESRLEGVTNEVS
jgi:hypothetical protein